MVGVGSWERQELLGVEPEFSVLPVLHLLQVLVSVLQRLKSAAESGSSLLQVQ